MAFELRVHLPLSGLLPLPSLRPAAAAVLMPNG
jgi:hypothetical protein